MLKWVLVFFGLAVAAAFVGLGGFAASIALAGKVLFAGFLALSALALVAHARRTDFADHA